MSFQNQNKNFYDILTEANDDNSQYIIKFHLKNKLGRKRNIEKIENGNQIKITKRTHTKRKKDNMRSKIMTHFSKFIISFLNDYGKKFYPNQKTDFFKKVDYKLRNKVNINSINEMMQKTLKEFCELKVSTKHRNCETLNLNSLNLLSTVFDKNFFEKKICEFYKDFYLKDIDELSDYGITNKTQNFISLLDKFNDDIEYKNALNETGKKLIEFANLKPYFPPIQPNDIIHEIEYDTDDSFLKSFISNFSNSNDTFDS